MIIILALFVNNLLGQTTFKYEYDAAGNRIKRQVINLKILDNNDKDSSNNEIFTEKYDPFDDKEDNTNLASGNIKIDVFPNPVHESLTVEIIGNAENCTYQVYDNNGKLIKNDKIYSKNTGYNAATINFSNTSVGTYLLIIYTGEIKREFKIVRNL